MLALTDLAAVALAALYLWMLASQLHTPVIRPVQRWLRRGWRRSLVGCPWCFGIYATTALALLVHWGRWDWIATPLLALAAAALVGLIGSNWTPGIEDEEEA